MKGREILRTERLLLREMTEEDFPALCKILQDEEVMYAYAHAFSDEEAAAWLENQFKRYRTFGNGLWAVVLKGTGEMIGQCGSGNHDWCLDHSGPDTDYFSALCHRQLRHEKQSVRCRSYACGGNYRLFHGESKDSYKSCDSGADLLVLPGFDCIYAIWRDSWSDQESEGSEVNVCPKPRQETEGKSFRSCRGFKFYSLLYQEVYLLCINNDKANLGN